MNWYLPKWVHYLVGDSLRLSAAVLVCTLLGGCTLKQQASRELQLAIDSRAQPGLTTTPSQSVDPYASTDANLAEQLPPDSLAEYIDCALANNPTIKSAISAMRAAFDQIPQSVSLPDPLLRMMSRPEPIRTAAGDLSFTLAVSQTFPVPAKLDKAGRVALAEARLAIKRLEAARLNVVTHVENGYYHLYMIDRSLEVAEEDLQSLKQLEAIVTTLYEVDRVLQGDVLYVQAELARSADMQQQLFRQRELAAAKLNELMNKPPESEVPTTTAMDPPAMETDFAELRRLALQHNPQLAVANSEVERGIANVELTQLNCWPDPTIGFEWNYVEPRDAFQPLGGDTTMVNQMSETGADSWAITLQFNIPLWLDKLHAQRTQARHRLMQARHARHATQNAVSNAVFDAWTRVRAHTNTAKVLRTSVIPQSRQAYDVSLSAYETGRNALVTIIERHRRLLDVELLFHKELAATQQAYADLKNAVGVQVISNPAGDPSSTGEHR